jgi:hypothetical protein
MFPGNEVRLMNAYFVRCTSCEKDADGKITVVHCTYDPASRGGESPDGRKVKGTIHWVAAKTAKSAPVRLYENLIDEEKGVYNEDGTMNINPDSLEIREHAVMEPALFDAEAGRELPVCPHRIFLGGSEALKERSSGLRKDRIAEELLQAAGRKIIARRIECLKNRLIEG